MSDWTKLAEPFPETEIKQRPGRGGMTFSYVDARAVAQRLDDVLTPANWSYTSSVVPGTDVVHGRLTLALGDGAITVREDFGYPNSDNDEEPIKAASSDALKRCAVLFGIGRHLYDDNKNHRSPSTGAGRGSPSTRPAARSSTDVPEFAPDGLSDGPRTAQDGRTGSGWTFGQLAKAAEDAGIAKVDIYRTADKLFGPKTKVTDLEPGQREQIAFEMGLLG